MGLNQLRSNQVRVDLGLMAIPKIFETGASGSDGFVSYLGHLLEGGVVYLCRDVYSTTQAEGNT